uniref:DNA repair nuclease/redox regulator APEX1 n=1 Tax=Plectus sambesii TaxID=2011161 RepID=A0A914VUU9_9BILA
MRFPTTALTRILMPSLVQSQLSFTKMPPKRQLSETSQTDSTAKKVKVSNGDSSKPLADSASEVVKAQNQCSDAPTLKLISWNVNGVRAWLKKKDCLKILSVEKPDILVIQETKCGSKDLPEEIKKVVDYHSYFQSSSGANGGNQGYTGVGLFSRTKPLNVTFGMDREEHDNEGRIITAEYEKFYLVGAYVPNAGRGLVRLKYRRTWNKDFLEYIKKLDEQKPVIYVGDLNVAHQEIDLANPKSNRNKTAGFTDEERADFDELLAVGFTDSYRHLYPTKKDAYTFWSYMGNARGKNVGWRLDYFLLSNRINEKICDCRILSDVMGSDHCPIEIKLAL